MNGMHFPSVLLAIGLCGAGVSGMVAAITLSRMAWTRISSRVLGLIFMTGPLLTGMGVVCAFAAGLVPGFSASTDRGSILAGATLLLQIAALHRLKPLLCEPVDPKRCLIEAAWMGLTAILAGWGVWTLTGIRVL